MPSIRFPKSSSFDTLVWNTFSNTSNKIAVDILDELKTVLTIPSVSTNPENIPDIKRCAEWIIDHLKKIGMQNVQIFSTAGHPIVYADWLHAPGKPTLLIYGHYDVQPVDPIELWTTPPFEATERDGNLYARGSADDKGQVFIHLKGIEAFLKNSGKLPINIKFIIEGEEEIGSEHLDLFVREHRSLLKSDLVLISDTSMYREKCSVRLLRPARTFLYGNRCRRAE